MIVRRIAAAVAAGAVAVSSLMLSSVPAQAAISGAELLPAVWNPGSAPQSTVTWSESTTAGAGNYFSLEIEWDWTVSFAALDSGNASFSTNTFTCPGSNITFSSAGFAGVGNTNASAKCTYINQGAGQQKKVTLEEQSAGSLDFAGGNSVTATIPAGVITASTVPKANYRWTVCSLNCNAGQFSFLYASVPAEAIAALNGVTYPPQPPTNIRAVKEYDVALDQDVIRVSWDAPADQGTLPVSHYSVYGGPDWGNPSHPVKLATCTTDSAAASLTSCVVRSGNAGYNPQFGANVFFVKAFNGLGWSGANSSNLLDVQFDPTPASAPLNVKAVGGFNSITVSWEKPVSKGGGGVITNYLAISDPSRKSCITTALTFDPNRKVDANPLTCTFTNLTPGTKYSFHAQALNGNGWGALSATSNVATPWNLKLDNYNRKWTFLRLNQEITVKGAGPGLPSGYRVGVEWRFPSGKSEGVWKEAGSTGTDAAGKFSWSHKIPKGMDKKAIVSVRFSALDPITKVKHYSNAVTIDRVK